MLQNRLRSGLRPPLELQTGRNTLWQPYTPSQLALQYLAFNFTPRQQTLLSDVEPGMLHTCLDMTCVLLSAGPVYAGKLLVPSIAWKAACRSVPTNQLFMSSVVNELSSVENSEKRNVCCILCLDFASCFKCCVLIAYHCLRGCMRSNVNKYTYLRLPTNVLYLRNSLVWTIC